MGPFSFARRVLAAFAFAGLLTNVAVAADNVSVVYNFTGNNDGGDPATGLAFDAAGNAYGTSVTGGASNCGTVFKLAPAVRGQWTETVLHAFGCFADGKNPHGGVTLHGGNLYGTTVAGGTGGQCDGDGCGEVFEVSAKGFHVLYNFTGGVDGFGPGNPVVFDAHGNLFGTTPDGGAHRAGTVYELSHQGARWLKKTLYQFTGKGDGGVGSLGPLLLDRAGNLYGVTEVGGTYGAGTAYELSPAARGAWNYKVLYEFKGKPDAGSPYGGLIAGPKGNLYGTTYYGGVDGRGSVFELVALAHGAWRERVLYSFAGGTDGAMPTSTLVFGSPGYLFATTSAGGRPSCDCGTVVALAIATGRESVVHAFGAAPDGSYPYYGLTADGRGNLFSTTVSGGLHGEGTIFGFTP